MIAVIVDDSALMRLVLRKALESLGYEVHLASDGNDAVTQLEKFPKCNLLLTDWHMPGMDGLELVAKVRRDLRYKTVRIVMITSDAVHDTVSKALAVGVDDVIMKPFTPEVFSEHIREVMGA